MTANHSTGRVEPITGQNESKNTKSWTQKGITSTSLHHRNIKTTSTDRESQDEDNNTFPIVVTQKTSEISSITSREKTQHATEEWMCLLVGTDSSTQTSKIQHKAVHTFISSSTFKQATTKTEDPKKPQVPRDQRTTTGTIPCATLIEHRHKTIVRSNDDADSDSGPRRQVPRPANIDRYTIPCITGCLIYLFHGIIQVVTSRYIRRRRMAQTGTPTRILDAPPRDSSGIDIWPGGANNSEELARYGQRRLTRRQDLSFGYTDRRLSRWKINCPFQDNLDKISPPKRACLGLAHPNSDCDQTPLI